MRSRDVITDMTVLGRNGLLNFARQLQTPGQMRALRARFGIPEPSESGEVLKSLYQVEHDVMPSDLWFLDSPLIGQKDEFIKKLLDAGKGMSSAFGEQSALGSSGYDTYHWLKKAAKDSGLSSDPLSSSRNREITERLLGADIPGSMFLRGGHRDINKAIAKPFDPSDFNFVTFDPSVTRITERFAQGGVA